MDGLINFAGNLGTNMILNNQRQSLWEDRKNIAADQFQNDGLPRSLAYMNDSKLNLPTVRYATSPSTFTLPSFFSQDNQGSSALRASNGMNPFSITGKTPTRPPGDTRGLGAEIPPPAKAYRLDYKRFVPASDPQPPVRFDLRTGKKIQEEPFAWNINAPEFVPRESPTIANGLPAQGSSSRKRPYM